MAVMGSTFEHYVIDDCVGWYAKASAAMCIRCLLCGLSVAVPMSHDLCDMIQDTWNWNVILT